MSAVLHLVRALPDLFRVSLAQVVAYRAEFVIWMLTAMLPLIMLALWSSVASEGAVAGLGQDELARYYVATMLVRQLTGLWLVWSFSFEVRTGALSGRLLKPMNPLWHEASYALSAIPLRLVVLIPLIGAVIAWRPSLVALPEPSALLLAVPALLLAWMLHFAVQCCFALLAFWIDKASGLWMVFFAIFAFLSGYVAPLALFPAWSRPVLEALPFAAMHALPAELLSGLRTPAQALPTFAVGLAWLVVLGALATVLWRRGLRRYGAFGG